MNFRTRRNKAAKGNINVDNVKGNVVFDHVNFGYDPEKQLLMISVLILEMDKNCYSRTYRSWKDYNG
ncbi:MAG: hypothetical protein ACLVE5_08395 [Clostridium perfringens]